MEAVVFFRLLHCTNALKPELLLEVEGTQQTL